MRGCSGSRAGAPWSVEWNLQPALFPGSLSRAQVPRGGRSGGAPALLPTSREDGAAGGPGKNRGAGGAPPQSDSSSASSWPVRLLQPGLVLLVAPPSSLHCPSVPAPFTPAGVPWLRLHEKPPRAIHHAPPSGLVTLPHSPERLCTQETKAQSRTGSGDGTRPRTSGSCVLGPKGTLNPPRSFGRRTSQGGVSCP